MIFEYYQKFSALAKERNKKQKQTKTKLGHYIWSFLYLTIFHLLVFYLENFESVLRRVWYVFSLSCSVFVRLWHLGNTGFITWGGWYFLFLHSAGDLVLHCVFSFLNIWENLPVSGPEVFFLKVDYRFNIFTRYKTLLFLPSVSWQYV